MTRERRKWTPEEDTLLQKAVQAAIAESRPLLWREISKSIPTRSNKDCRRRWCNSLSTALSKGPWTESEDERLWNAVQKHGPRWSLVAGEVGSRNADQCSSHWGQTLNPEIDFGDWSGNDDELLRRSVERHGTNWSTIASLYFPKRTSLALRNRYNALDARGKALKQTHQHRHQRQHRKVKSGSRVEKKPPRRGSRSSPVQNGNSMLGCLRAHEKEYDDCSDDDYDDHDDDEEEDEDSENSSVDRQETALHRHSGSDSWMNPSSSTTASSASNALVETPPPFDFSQSSQYNTIPYTLPDLVLYNDPSCWDGTLGVSGPKTETTPIIVPELEKAANDASFSYPSPTTQNVPVGTDQSVFAMHRVSIDVECTSQQLPQIMNSVIAIGGRVTMRLNHSSPDSGG
ncbi:hypothetical protein BJX70DRAFT_396170 [Aspergillus crustosus]